MSELESGGTSDDESGGTSRQPVGTIRSDRGEGMPASDAQESGSDTFEVTVDLPGPVSLWANLESELGSQMVEPTVDTGACVSMISHALWWHSGCSELTGAALPVLYDANGQLLDVNGQTMVYLEMEGRPYRFLMYIVGNLGTDCC